MSLQFSPYSLIIEKKGENMTAIRLDLSIESLKKCYTGKDKDGKCVLDKSKIDELAFLFASDRISQAIENKEITEEEFIEKLISKDS